MEEGQKHVWRPSDDDVDRIMAMVNDVRSECERLKLPYSFTIQTSNDDDAGVLYTAAAAAFDGKYVAAAPPMLAHIILGSAIAAKDEPFLLEQPLYVRALNYSAKLRELVNLPEH